MFLDRLIDIFKSIDDEAYLCIFSYSKDADKYPRENYYRVNRLNKSIFSYFAKQSKDNQRMISCSMALFPTQKRSKDTANFLYDVFIDVDNLLYKSQRLQYENIEERLKFLEKTSKRLMIDIKQTLIKSGLDKYATIICSGAGYHVHFFLSKPVPLSSEVDRYGINKDNFKIIMSLLSQLFGADEQATQISSLGKYIPGTFYWKESQPIPVEVLKEAEEFISFDVLFTNLTILAHNLDLLIPEKVEKKSDHNPFRVNEENRDTEETNTFKGQSFENDDGSQIDITNNYKMYVKQRSRKKDDDGNFLYDHLPVHTGYALFPEYCYENDELMFFIFQAKNKKESKLVKISNKEFANSEKLQDVFCRNLIDINIGKLRGPLFSYAKTFCQAIKATNVGANSNLLAHYDFIYRKGQVYKSENNIVNTGDDKYYLIGEETKFEMLRNPRFAKPEINFNSDSLIKLFETKLNNAYRNRSNNQLFIAFLAAALIRDKLLNHFQDFPIINLYGEGSTGKSFILNIASMIFNIKLITAPTVPNIYRKQKDWNNMLVMIDDLHNVDKPDFIEFLKNASSNSTRTRQYNGETNNTSFKNSVIITTNYCILDDALNTRIIKMHMTEENKTDKDHFLGLKYFIEDNCFELLLALYEKIYSVDIPELIKTIKIETRKFDAFITNSRLSEIYSILFVIGMVLGLDISINDLEQNVIQSEKRQRTNKHTLIDAIVEFISYCERPSEDIENYTLTPYSIDQVYYIKFGEFADYLERNHFDNYISQKSLSKEFQNYSFITEKQTARKIKGKYAWGKYILVNIGDDNFSEFFKRLSNGQYEYILGDDK